jgi:hypothetical protein
MKKTVRRVDWCTRLAIMLDMKSVRISENSMKVESTRRAIIRDCQDMADELQARVELHDENGSFLQAFAPRSAEYRAWLNAT